MAQRRSSGRPATQYTVLVWPCGGASQQEQVVAIEAVACLPVVVATQQREFCSGWQFHRRCKAY